MKPLLKFAAIDIGSNAVRVLFANVATETNGKVHFHKVSLIRVPVRLGSDVFTNGLISEERKADLIKTLQAYKNLMDVYRVDEGMAYATSAMREAKNGEKVAKEVSRKTGIEIQIIDGNTEAEAIHATRAGEDLESTCLYIDVGGGSTELTLIIDGVEKASRSFKIGTVRLLENLVFPGEWDAMERWVKENTEDCNGLTGIGTGGNINKIFKESGTRDGHTMSLAKLKKTVNDIESYSLEERVSILGLREDRADVIIPAANIYKSVMKWADIKKIHVPRIGLADGMIHIMYERLKKD
jgi:exopolyphosphatase/guanosine-5'-triphosphate,3'-diphosphate pyrophosphatase